MDYRLALADDMPISPSDFVAVWNVNSDCRAAAEAHLLPHNLIALQQRTDVEVTEHTVKNLIQRVLRKGGVSNVSFSSEVTPADTLLFKVSMS